MLETVKRPWGQYTTLYAENHLKLKRITINPGTSMSLQYHTSRGEVWVMGKDPLYIELIENTEDFAVLKADLTEEEEIIQIQAGVIHRVTNPTNKPVTFIELQYGSAVDENDIVRLTNYITEV